MKRCTIFNQSAVMIKHLSSGGTHLANRLIFSLALAFAVLIMIPATSSAGHFAEYDEPPVEYTPQIPAYSYDDLELEGEQYESLLKNGISIGRTHYYEFFQLYEDNRYFDIPTFITTDSILHNYHLFFGHLLKKVEEDKLSGLLKELNQSMLDVSLEQYETLKDSDWENAARRNVAFFAVATKLLNKNAQIPPIVKNEVEKELSLINAHQGIAISSLMNMGANNDIIESLKEDYTQYIPRGHYTRSELLSDYFRTMMWYGRITFVFKEEDQVKSAVLISYALEGDRFNKWQDIFEPISFFVGLSDDITSYQMKDAISAAYGDGFNWKYLPGANYQFYHLIEILKDLDPPQINSVPIFDESIQPDREEATKGFRFMGQRFTIDASIYQQLADRKVPGRMLPSGLDVPAAMGSDEALDILDMLGHTKYPNYSENMAKVREFIAGLDKETWTQNLYWCWLYTLDALIQDRGEGYPYFMLNQAWTRKELNTFLSSYAELKHDTVLYAKQFMSEGGGGGEWWPDRDDRGYVEPNPELYARLCGLIRMTQTGLESRGLISEDDKRNLEILEELVFSLKVISEKQLNNQLLTDEEYELIRSYGVQLEHFWLEVNKERMKELSMYQHNYLQNYPAWIITDVATDPGGRVLQIGTGRIHRIIAIVPIDGKPRVAVGAIFSYYEFPWPLSDRLTNEKWREILWTMEREHGVRPLFFSLDDEILNADCSISIRDIYEVHYGYEY